GGPQGHADHGRRVQRPRRRPEGRARQVQRAAEGAERAAPDRRLDAGGHCREEVSAEAGFRFRGSPIPLAPLHGTRGFLAPLSPGGEGSQKSRPNSSLLPAGRSLILSLSPPAAISLRRALPMRFGLAALLLLA